MNVLDKIKTGDYNLVAKFMNYDIKNAYQFPDNVIEDFISSEELRKRHPIKYNIGDYNNNSNEQTSKVYNIKNKNKNKMDTIIRD